MYCNSSLCCTIAKMYICGFSFPESAGGRSFDKMHSIKLLINVDFLLKAKNVEKVEKVLLYCLESMLHQNGSTWTAGYDI